MTSLMSIPVQERRFVYAIYFESQRVVKIGYAVNVDWALDHANKRMWKASLPEDGKVVWCKAGGQRIETWLQVNIAFECEDLWWQTGTRLTEWFVVSEPPGELTAKLDRLYQEALDKIAKQTPVTAVIP